MKYNLTSSQLNFYTKDSTLDSLLWNQGVVEIFPKIYSSKELNDACNMLIKNNAGMRIRIKKENDNTIKTYINEFVYTDRPFFKLNSDDDILKAAEEFLNTPTTFFGGELIRLAIFQSPTKSGYIVSGHHIACDGLSAFILCDHINQYIKGETPPESQTYDQFIEREKKYINSKRFNSDKRFWKEMFSCNPTCNILTPRGNVLDFSSDEINYSISEKLVSKIKKFCKEKEITLTTFINTITASYITQKYYVNKFTLGTAVLNRTTQIELNTIGLYMHIVPSVFNLQEKPFIDNAKIIEDEKISLYKHQKFTQQNILDLLKEEGASTSQLFDFACSVQEFPHNDDFEINIIYHKLMSAPVEIHFRTFGNGKNQLKIRYRTVYLEKFEAKEMAESLINMMDYAVANPDENILRIPMYSKEMLQKVLYDFNDTFVPYPQTKCIHELFEEQAEKTPDKTAVIARDKTLTYKQLNEQANRIAHSLTEKGVCVGDIVGFKLPRRSYLLSTVLGILKTGAAYLPVDPEHPQDRIEYMLKDSKAKLCITEENIEELLSCSKTENLNISVSPDDICYCIYTSGSTGMPKSTLLSHKNAVNYVSKNDKNVLGGVIKEKHRSILSVTTVGFDIFVTESLLPLVNGLEIVLADENESKIQAKLSCLIKNNPVDVIQTTPTKMKSLILDKTQLDFLKTFSVIILGGETLDRALVKELKQHTNAKIYNIYGPAETTVWVTNAEITDEDDITIGKPMANTQIYILDKYMKPTPIGVTGELCIAGDGVGQGYLNNEELTKEKFINNPFGEGKLYKTGDLAYWREDGNIVYVGRNDFQVKIRGLRIELGEIESVLCDVDKISQSAVVVRENSENRQLICAFYTGEEIDAKEIRNIIGEKLPKYMLPHIFTHLDEMPLTVSGKIDRNALPEIDLESISTETEYVAPSTEKEKLLVEAVETVLKAEKVSLLDNFFDLGGDSLKSIELTSVLERKGYTVNIKSIFAAKDIEALAKELSLNEKTETKSEYDSVLPATAAQMRVYTQQMLAPLSTLYNVNYAFKTDKVNKEKLEKAVNSLIERHESLRTHFENRDGIIYQVIDETAETKVEKLKDVNSFVKAFDLGKSPLIHVGCNDDTVVIDMHHIAVDGETMPVLFSEFNELYMERPLENTVQYGEFAVQQNDFEASEKYWLDVFSKDIPVLELPTDYQRGAVQSFNGSMHYKFIEKQLHQKIEEKCKQRGITPFVYYMACFSVLLSKLSGNEDIVIGTPISGRTSKFLNTVGMFVNTVALRSKPFGDKTFRQLTEDIKEASIAAIDNQNYPFNQLVKKLGIDEKGRNPLYDVMLAYQSYDMTDITFGDKKAELLPMKSSAAKCDLTFTVLPRKDDVVLAAEYCTDLFKEKKIEQFTYMYNRLLEACLDDEKYIKDISLI
ncbi:MAG: amino acid adenylation domain-containing protein, partial [Acutalibacteraceae bacterium]